MDEVLAELDMGVEHIDVLIHYRIVQSNDNTYVDFQSVWPISEYLMFKPEHRRDIEESARKWCSDNALILCEPSDQEPGDHEDQGMGFF